MRLALALVITCAWCTIARADDEADADAAMRAALARSQTDPAGAMTDLEALGAGRPLTRWSDNAWSEVARLAEAAGDFTRARHALEQIITIDMDEVMVRRARLAIERLSAKTGGGQWDAIAKRHEQLVTAIFGGDDPHAELAELEALVGANPTYPRSGAARISIARGWEMEGDADLALAWMRRAADAAGPDERGQRTRLELARMALRVGELDVASREIAVLRTSTAADHAAVAALALDLASAERRQWMRRAVWVVLALLGFVALARLARDLASNSRASAEAVALSEGARSSSEALSASDAPSDARSSSARSSSESSSTRARFAWGAALRRLVRPPIEAIFMLPIGGLVVAIAATGNPRVARAIAVIVGAGVAVAWCSGVLVDVAREQRRLSRKRLAVHLVCVTLAVACVVFLAVERGVIQLVIETWHGGHQLR